MTSPPAGPWVILSACAATLAVSLALVGGIGILALNPIREDVVKIETSIDKINMQMAPLLTVNEHVADLNQQLLEIKKLIDQKLNKDIFDGKVFDTEKEIEDNKTSTLHTFEELSHQVHDLESNIVSKDWNKEHWDAVSAQILDLKGQVSALRLELEGARAAKP
jgi:chromosome segregation ATPase